MSLYLTSRGHYIIDLFRGGDQSAEDMASNVLNFRKVQGELQLNYVRLEERYLRVAAYSMNVRSLFWTPTLEILWYHFKLR